MKQIITNQYNNIIYQREIVKDYARHQQRIEQIVKQQRDPRQEINQYKKNKQNNQNIKQINANFVEQTKQYEINVQNQKLLTKLIDIQNGRQCQFTQKQFIEHDKSFYDRSPRGLISPFRKKKASQIQEENSRIAQRILNQQSFLQKEKLNVQEQEYLKIKKNRSKFKKLFPSLDLQLMTYKNFLNNDNKNLSTTKGRSSMKFKKLSFQNKNLYEQQSELVCLNQSYQNDDLKQQRRANSYQLDKFKSFYAEIDTNKSQDQIALNNSAIDLQVKEQNRKQNQQSLLTSQQQI